MIIAKLIVKNMGFFTDKHLPAILTENRLHPCLVRCGSGRFQCPAQDVQHFVKIITEHGGDYVRDVSLLRI